MSRSGSENKKPKPICNPRLMLQTPIAYNGNSDLSILPIDKDGIAICEKCGAVGVKHSFYTKQRKFCSVTCAKSSGNAYYRNENTHHQHKKYLNYKFKLMEDSNHLEGMLPVEPLPNLQGCWQPTIDTFTNPLKAAEVPNTYTWSDQLLFACDFLAAPVKLFAHAPLSGMWDNIFEGMKVEVQNHDLDDPSEKLLDYFWVATVLKLKGYMGLLRYEGFGNDSSKDFWVNLMHSEVHPVGWCATRGKPLIPPQSIENKYSDWKSYLVRQLTGARTLPNDFYTKITESIQSRFRVGHVLEVVNKNTISRVIVAVVQEIIGKRLHVRYYNNAPDDYGFWFHEDSPLIHPVGWARSVGHLLDAPANYIERLQRNERDPNDATPDLFKYYTVKDPYNLGFDPVFVEGMKIEAIDPLNLSSICEATVRKVLNKGFIMVSIDIYPPSESGADWFCYHKYSPCIFPAGFCAEHHIPMTMEAGQLPVMPPNLSSPFVPVVPQHDFVTGMKLECADLMDPRLVCVATIARVVGRLLKVHFDGWGDEYDQWLDCESPDIYPVGWCKVVGHKLEAPFKPSKQLPPPILKKRGRKKKSGRINSDLKNSSNSGSSNSGNTPKMEIEESSVDLPTENQTTKDEYDENSIQNMINPNKQNSMDIDNMNFDIEMDQKPLFDISEGEEYTDNSVMDIPDISPLEEKADEAKYIPRLDNSFHLLDSRVLSTIDPDSWTTQDVAQFLTINDCCDYCVNFSHVNGKMMLALSKDDTFSLMDNKVGPSIKIYELIQQLKCKLIPVQARLKAA